MSTMVNTGPVGHHKKQAIAAGNARGDRHSTSDPAEWGWRRPSADELVAEHLDKIEQMLGEQG